MTITLETPPASRPLTLERTVSLRRRVTDRVATVVMGLALLVAAVPLGWVLVIVVSKGFHLVATVDWWTKDVPTNVTSAALASKFGAAPEKVTYGMGPAIYGTLLITALAALFSIPLGIMGAVYLNEFGKKRRFASVVRFFTDVMTGVPSVVMGIFIYTVWVLHFGATGRSAIAGALALGCLMLPIVVRSTEEMLRLVPDDLRQASAALGVPTWRTVVTVVLPAALPGITSGAMLAVARAAGETAPLLFTIGSVHELHLSPFGQNTALSSQIFSNATQPGGTSLAWGAALTLIVIVVVLTVVARLVTSRLSVGGER
jgi:phosphate transport system permease protein